MTARPNEEGLFEIGRTYRFTSDYLVRETAERCGPRYQSQIEPQPCDLFVHEFPDGLPPGRYHFWIEWRAPCSAWAIADVCDDPDQPLSLFASQASMPFFHDGFTPQDESVVATDIYWPFDPWGIFLFDP